MADEPEAPLECKQCGSTNVVKNGETGELVCKDCGAKMMAEE